MAKITQQEAVRQAIVELLGKGRRVTQEGFINDVGYAAAKKCGRLWVTDDSFKRGMALVPNLRFNNDSRLYYLDPLPNANGG